MDLPIPTVPGHGQETSCVSLLDNIGSPAELRRLSRESLHRVVDEVRERHIDVVSQIGGHFGATLGVAELTVALHAVFDTPRDKLIWDTGHQAYIHKILTGRNERFPTIRQKDGLSPFLRRDESEYDVFGAGHAATSISAGLGIAAARDHFGKSFSVVSIIGDGAMGCGLAYEALNNAGHTDRDFIVLLNDNDMSIAPNVGAMNKYLNSVITNPIYNRVRAEVKSLFQRTPSSVMGMVEGLAHRFEDSIKHLFVPGMIFEELGFRYVGPVDGHDLDALMDTLEGVRGMKGPILLHVVTQKGKGFTLAEENPFGWHAASPFDKITGKNRKSSIGLPRYQKVFGEAIAELGAAHPEVAVITAAMPDGTSTDLFAERFPERFYDVGIAEGHGVTFAAGLATEGVRPIVAIYSTFLQRGYDNIVHDVALQDLPVIFCMDRAGLAGPDGPTHHGGLDIAYMLAVPGMTVTAPKDGRELVGLLRSALAHTDGPFSIRYPRASVPEPVPSASEIEAIPYASWEVLREGHRIALLATGTMVLECLGAITLLEERGISCTLVNCRYLKPFDETVLDRVLDDHDLIITVEEGTVMNGFGAFIGREISERRGAAAPEVHSIGLPDRFIAHGSRAELLEEVGLDEIRIADRIEELAKNRSIGEDRRESA